eukprot:718327-Prymnesium_polylepis.1
MLGYAVSTLAVVQMRQKVPGFAVPRLKADAAQIFCDVGGALATGDLRRLQELTTPMCYSTMSKSLLARPKGETHNYRALDAQASVVQFRVGHHASEPDRKFAQATCSISAKVVWTIKDGRGKAIGGVGTEDAPFELCDHWVFERIIEGEGAESSTWRLKVRLDMPDVSRGVLATWSARGGSATWHQRIADHSVGCGLLCFFGFSRTLSAVSGVRFRLARSPTCGPALGPPGGDVVQP